MSIQVQTTHNVVIDYEAAGAGRRILAYFIDWIFILLWYFLWIFSSKDSPVYRIFDGDTSNWNDIFLMILIITPALFYDLLFEYFNKGRTPGKMIIGIRVISIYGSKPSFGSYFIRWIFRIIDFSFTYGILAIIMVAASKKSQRLGDYLADTTVIDTKLNRGNKELSITDLDFHDNYKVTYPDVLFRLSDRDIQSILSIINGYGGKNNEFLKTRLLQRVKMITGYSLDVSITGEHFLRTIVNDYHYLATLEQ